jgi:hypothetical protein
MRTGVLNASEWRLATCSKPLERSFCPLVADEVNIPPYKSELDDGSWRTFLYNQERMLTQQNALLETQKRLVEAMEKVASPERVRGVELGMEKMVIAVNELSGKMDGAGNQLGLAVDKLSSAFWGLMKVPVAVVMVGAASWAFLYEGKISERTWLIMIAVSVFPWLGDSISAISRVIRGHHPDKAP